MILVESVFSTPPIPRGATLYRETTTNVTLFILPIWAAYINLGVTEGSKICFLNQCLSVLIKWFEKLMFVNNQL